MASMNKDFYSYLINKRCVLDRKTIIYLYINTLNPTLTTTSTNSFTINNTEKVLRVISFIDVNFSIRANSGGLAFSGTNNIVWNSYIIKNNKQIFFNTTDLKLQTQKEIPIVSSGMISISTGPDVNYSTKKGGHFPSENEQFLWYADEKIMIEYAYKVTAAYTLKAIVTYGVLE